jgi:dienelactone hydrolase
MRTALAALLIAASAHADPITSEALLRAPALQRVALNPAGTLSFVQGYNAGTQTVTVRTTSNGASTTVFSHDGAIEVEWEDDDTLIVQAGEGGPRSVIDLELLDFGVVSRAREVTARGWFIDPLPLVPGEVLWADWDGAQSAVFRVPIEELLRPANGSAPDAKYLVARLSKPVIHWVADAQGVPRAALTLADDDPIRVGLLERASADGRWRELGEWSPIDPFPFPVGMAADGRDLLVLSSEGSDTAALRRYDVDERRIGEVIFAQPGADVSGVVLGYHSSEVIAAYWESAGIRRYHYFDEFDSAQQKWLDERYPDQAVHLTSRTVDRRLFTILVSGPRNPGELHLLDAQKRTVRKLGAVMPWLAPAQLAPVNGLEVKARDGKTIEAFLARPAKFTGRRPPLVVMPHGGPIGVQDTRDFNPVVQSLAAQGYAVLQVNYRGSSGKGAGFLDAGRGAWGMGIEDDIEAALDHVVAARSVDAERVCIFGGSYGGYSALIGITRRPQRYRCAAAFAAPTDLILLASEYFDDEYGRTMFARIAGDPDADRERLIAVSPAYRASEMDVPILLIQGDRDRVVDPEHAYRMRAMLEAYGKPCEWMLIEGATHAPTPEQTLQLLERLNDFLAKYLEPGRAAAPRSRRRPGRSSPRAARRWSRRAVCRTSSSSRTSAAGCRRP